MTRPRGGEGSRRRSSGRNREVPANPNIIHRVSRGQVMSRDQAATSHRGTSIMAHDVITKDINEDTAVEELGVEEGNRSDIAIWTDELTSSVKNVFF